MLSKKCKSLVPTSTCFHSLGRREGNPQEESASEGPGTIILVAGRGVRLAGRPATSAHHLPRSDLLGPEGVSFGGNQIALLSLQTYMVDRDDKDLQARSNVAILQLLV